MKQRNSPPLKFPHQMRRQRSIENQGFSPVYASASAQFNSAQDPFSLFTALFPFSENVCMSLNEYMVLDKHQSLLSKHVFVQWI